VCAGEEGRSAFDAAAGAMSSRAALQGIIDQIVALTGGVQDSSHATENGSAVCAH
jgi:hypothetical protein